ncbi:MAG: hypothetical protein L0Y56_21420 [Nitrospira sp.]|nr:hypothetical protein [Nitrospira sp.]
MKKLSFVLTVAGIVVLSLTLLRLPMYADEQHQHGAMEHGKVIKPNPAAIVVPQGYKVELFASGLDAPASVAVDKDGNVWVAESGPCCAPGASQEGLSATKLKVFDKSGKLIKTLGEGEFLNNLLAVDYNPENGMMYAADYGRMWEINPQDWSMKIVIKDLPMGDHVNDQMAFKDGYIYWGQGFPSNTGYADPDNHGWVDWKDPFWGGQGPHDPPCRDIVLTGLNVRSSDGRITGAFLPAGTPSEPGQVVKGRVPCGGSIMRAKLSDKGADGIISHDKMEVYAYGFRNPYGVAFAPDNHWLKGALFTSVNGPNDIGHRRVANGPETIYIVHQGMDYGFPDKFGFLDSTAKTFSMRSYANDPMSSLMAPWENPFPNLYLGNKPYMPAVIAHGTHVIGQGGVRGVPRLIANPNEVIGNPIAEFDPNISVNGMEFSKSEKFGMVGDLFAAIIGHFGVAPEGLEHKGHNVVRLNFLQPMGVVITEFARNKKPGPSSEQAPEEQGGLERPNDVTFDPSGEAMYIVDWGLMLLQWDQPAPLYITPGSGNIWKITKM